MKKISFATLLFLFIGGISHSAFGQEYNPIPIAVPSLQIAPDARGGGMAISVEQHCPMFIHNIGMPPNMLSYRATPDSPFHTHPG